MDGKFEIGVPEQGLARKVLEEPEMALELEARLQVTDRIAPHDSKAVARAPGSLAEVIGVEPRSATRCGDATPRSTALSTGGMPPMVQATRTGSSPRPCPGGRMSVPRIADVTVIGSDGCAARGDAPAWSEKLAARRRGFVVSSCASRPLQLRRAQHAARNRSNDASRAGVPLPSIAVKTSRSEGSHHGRA